MQSSSSYPSGFTESAQPSRSRTIFWLGLSLAIAALCGLLVWRQAFGEPFVIQDDARQHIVWLRRLSDPTLFPNDLIANYYWEQAPAGLIAFYWCFAKLGLDPVVVSKAIPAVLGLVATAYGFGVTLQILPIPFAGFLASLLLNQTLWFKDDLASGTARAFVYPLFLAFLYYLLRWKTTHSIWRSLIPCFLALTLMGLFYPSSVLVAAGVLVLQVVTLDAGRLRFSRQRQDWILSTIGLGIAVLVLLPYVLIPSSFEPVVTAAEARTMPEFSANGRNSYFIDSSRKFWLFSSRSGFFPNEWESLPHGYFPVLLAIGLLLPLLWRFSDRFPLVKQLRQGVWILPQMALVSISLFFAAHLLLFTLYLPSRYTQPSLRMLTAIAAGIALTIVLDALLQVQRRARAGFSSRRVIALAIVAGVMLTLLAYPVALRRQGYPFPDSLYQYGTAPNLYRFLAGQPQDTVVASLEREANNIPAFTNRSVLVGREFAIAFHQGYYDQIRQRVSDLLNAQYSSDMNVVRAFAERYGIDFWLVDRDRLTSPMLSQARYAQDRSEMVNDRWIGQFQPGVAAAMKRAQAGERFIVAEAAERCRVAQSDNLLLLETDCILRSQ